MADRLTVLGLKSLPPGWHCDGKGLYAVIRPTGARSWVFRYRRDGKLHDLGLGSLSDVSLKAARAERDRLRALRHEGTDPLAHKRARQAAQRLADAAAITFRSAAESYIAANKAAWKNEKHAAQWTATLDAYVFPTIGATPVGSVTTDHVVSCLLSIWSTKPETASRVRGRIEAVLDFAKARGWCAGENPARWRGHLSAILPKRSKVAAVEHHAALPFAELPAFMAELSAQPGTSALALRFAVLTAARTSEVLGATWAEIDMTAETWVLPPERMKAGKEHRVPLCAEAMAVLQARMPTEGQPEGVVFSGARAGKPLSNMALLMTLRRMERSDLTAHGFRSTFRDWTAEATHYPPEVAEMALAHSIGSKVEAAYRRGDLFAKRREMMTAWGTFCSPTGARE